MLQKSQIFSFLVSFLITFAAGFFIWNIFIAPDNGVLNQVLGEIDKISSKFLLASVLPNQQDETIIPATNSAESESAADQNLSPDADSAGSGDIVEQNPVIAPSEDVQDQLDDIQEK